MAAFTWRFAKAVIVVAFLWQWEWQVCGAVRLLASGSSVKLQKAQLLDAFADNSTTDSVLSPNSNRRALSGCGNGNPVDDCWRCNPNWSKNRQQLADCALGFGRNAVGGKNGGIYVVTDDSDDDVVNPKEGTLRYGVIQVEPLWIIFSRNMNIKLKQELIMNSYKTLDGRGNNVHIAGGACLTLQYINNVIIHGIHIHDCQVTGPADVRSSPSHYGRRGKSDGDAVNIFGSRDIWVDHCYFSNSADGLVDVIQGSTDVTISNNYFENHDKVMLLGAHPNDSIDKGMRVTVAFNHFGANLIERMPRCRQGTFHVVNNNYQGWGMYAIGGSENPIINSEGNRFYAPDARFKKQVTKQIDDGHKENENSWNWRSSGDMFLNGAIFGEPGAQSASTQFFAKATSFSARPAVMVQSMTNDAGPLAL
ncbi:probable pectate lyase 5 [Physcomitrium patens]|uniref:Pectate lyase n=1 Tax=Physcomitrium patens TaxID=3218 RepID=A0A2K1LAQ4_PHYPA|nr:probable pectate lyase 5 [Physcomitrium patens]XP_024359946.1 probable pectate lyase 5 [Physcomitrium patens]PNR63107.1 hypothetical protein PHYPA_001532 [Physcomitrium patens]|eukprot:XP_024359854.1 probable pectate lyase 5 [Physcomitrella patens]